jgi:hypothetical protein
MVDIIAECAGDTVSVQRSCYYQSRHTRRCLQRIHQMFAVKRYGGCYSVR